MINNGYLQTSERSVLFIKTHGMYSNAWGISFFCIVLFVSFGVFWVFSSNLIANQKRKPVMCITLIEIGKYGEILTGSLSK